MVSTANTEHTGAADTGTAPVAKHMISAFATPIVNYRWRDTDELNAALRKLVLELEQSEPGVARSNVGGWHSGLDFLDRRDHCVTSLRRRLDAFVSDLNAAVFEKDAGRQPGDFSLQGWANVLRRGGYNGPHSHPNAFWSGVYYVTGNETLDGHPFSGKLELVDPRPGASLGYAEQTRLYGRFLLSPVAGQMILFPSWLQHWVHPYHGDGTRISIAFNVTLS